MRFTGGSLTEGKHRNGKQEEDELKDPQEITLLRPKKKHSGCSITRTFPKSRQSHDRRLEGGIRKAGQLVQFES